MESKGHFCYGCNEYFHDSRFGITTHKGCKGKKNLGICVDSKEWGEYHPYNLEEKSKLHTTTMDDKFNSFTLHINSKVMTRYHQV